MSLHLGRIHETMNFFICTLICVNLALGLVDAAPVEDEITNLPGLPTPPPFKQYSGYLDVGDGKHLFYWFVEAETVDPATAPIVFWFNGGPGCSSLDGFLTEQGPYRVNADGATLSYNPYNWNKVANMIFLDSPAGVGFSYADDATYISSDDETAQDNYIAVGKFYEKFPEYAQNELFITGESYAGIYVPMLSYLIVNGSNNYNFQAFAVGNGLHNYESNFNTEILFYAFHGLIDSTLTTRLLTYCCIATTPVTCNFAIPLNAECQQALELLDDALLTAKVLDGINVYGVYDECETSSSSARRRHMNAAKYEFLTRQFSKNQRFFKEFQENLNSDPPCTSSEHESEWINQPDVRAALHIPDVAQDWVICSDILTYFQQYLSMKEQYDYLLSHVRALVYSGDTDTMCNYLGSEWFVEELGRDVVKQFRPWRYEDQTAGFVKDFNNVTYLTVLGAGHMVPTDRPAQALAMFTNFLANTPYDS